LILGYLLASLAFSYSGSGFETEALSLHNQVRALHHAPLLVWDQQLAQYAQAHARHCVFKHSALPYGENLAAGFPSLTAAIQFWYSEHKHYSYQKSVYQHEAGHFTQLVWVSTKKLGCASVACNGKHSTPGNYLVCEYSPAGNVLNAGYFKTNVLPMD